MVSLRKTASSGFTLIELLIVVSIIAILSIVVVTNLSSARAKARDAKVTQDLSEVNNGIALLQANGDDLGVLKNTRGTTGFGTLIIFLKDTSKHEAYIAQNASIVDPLSNGTPPHNYEFAANVDGVTLHYYLCGYTEMPSDSSKHWFVNNDGSTYMSETSPCENPTW